MTVSQHSIARHSATRSAFAVSLLALLLATVCQHDDVVATGPAQHLELSVGDRFDVLLRAAALGSYKAPPTISTPAVEFLEATLVDEAAVPPGGPLQRFRFRATALGIALITFMPAQAGPVAFDTVVVR